jgi:hypothetical protein
VSPVEALWPIGGGLAVAWFVHGLVAPRPTVSEFEQAARPPARAVSRTTALDEVDAMVRGSSRRDALTNAQLRDTLDALAADRHVTIRVPDGVLTPDALASILDELEIAWHD